MHNYSEKITRYWAVNEEGKLREILERITYERQPGVGQGPDALVEINRRYDLQTGECLNRLGETEFEERITGARLWLQP
jgi:hypothetical protein